MLNGIIHQLQKAETMAIRYSLEYYDGNVWTRHSLHVSPEHAGFVQESIEEETQDYRTSWRIQAVNA